MIVALISGQYDGQGVEALVELSDEQALAFEKQVAELESRGTQIRAELRVLYAAGVTGNLREERITRLRAESKENYDQQKQITQRIRAAAKPLEKSMLLYLPGT